MGLSPPLLEIMIIVGASGFALGYLSGRIRPMNYFKNCYQTGQPKQDSILPKNSILDKKP